jgi:4-hydroxythreonine-4-phosphate dehydrogenase
MSTSSNVCQRLLITPGDPAGIGPDITLALTQSDWPQQLVAVADPVLLRSRAEQLGLSVQICEIIPEDAPVPSPAGKLYVLPQSLEHTVHAGVEDAVHAGYVLACLDLAIESCQRGDAAAMVTGPISKAAIIEAGHTGFKGHTEYLAEKTGTERVVMMLASDVMRVALVTTHLPLRAVPDAVTADEIKLISRILHKDLRKRFGLDQPRILVCGLNPHAGESGHMGREEIDVIIPALEALREEGLNLTGPAPADTAFTPTHLAEADAVLAMYHDQGLSVIKHASFGETVNITLGLPIIRTSVDHGTAFDLAGSGKASAHSLKAAVTMAAQMAEAV